MLEPAIVSGRTKRIRTKNAGRNVSAENPCALREEEMGELLRRHCDLLQPIVSTLLSRPNSLDRTFIEAISRMIGAGEDPLKSAFLSRACSAIVRMASALSPRALGEVVGQSTDYHLLLHALAVPETLTALLEEDPLAEARLRGLESRAELLRAEGGSLSVSEVAARLGITRQAVDKRRRNRQLLALPLGQNRHAYPAWQFTEKGVLAGLEEALQAFEDDAPWSNEAFFLSRSYALNGNRPLDELRRGNIDGVRRAAALRGEQIAV